MPGVAIKLYMVQGSHPCAAVAMGMEMKGLPFKVFEYPPPMHAFAQKLIFGKRTVPALKMDGEKVSGTIAIMRRLDELVPEPALFTANPAVATVAEWGVEDFQQIPRDLLWAGLRHKPSALWSFAQNSRLRLPKPAVIASSPLIIFPTRAINKTNDVKARRRLDELPAMLDKVDAWIAEGTIGDAAHPNAADLSVLSTVRLLSTIGDVRPLLNGRPCDAAARALWPVWDGDLPAGIFRAAA
jgi:glutathione S-transferase